MLELQTDHGSFNYEFEFVRAGMVVLRAVADGRSVPTVVSDGKDVTRFAVEQALDQLMRNGRRRQGGTPRPPAHLLPPYHVKDLSKVISRRAAWTERHETQQTKERAEWRRLHQAALAYLGDP